ncbi:MAG: TOBE domain-containing protein [bacterium]
MEGTFSVRNRISAAVKQIEEQPQPVVHLSASDESVIARLTPQAMKELELTPGDKLELLIKSSNIRILSV